VKVYYVNRDLGRQFIGHTVTVQYDHDAHKWLIADRHDRETRRHSAPAISRGEIVTMNFRPRPRRCDRKPPARQNLLAGKTAERSGW
jgi:hypothetical protein